MDRSLSVKTSAAKDRQEIRNMMFNPTASGNRTEWLSTIMETPSARIRCSVSIVRVSDMGDLCQSLYFADGLAWPIVRQLVNHLFEKKL